MIQVTELGYMGIDVSDLDAWKQYARDLLALEVVDEAEGNRCYLRMDCWHHRLVLHAKGADDLAYLGFRVAGANEFGAMQRQLADAGIRYRIGSPAEAEERRVLEVMKLEDPDVANDHVYSFYFRSPSGFNIEYGCGGRAALPTADGRTPPLSRRALPILEFGGVSTTTYDQSGRPVEPATPSLGRGGSAFAEGCGSEGKPAPGKGFL